MRARKGLYESNVVPTVLYGQDLWGLKDDGRTKINVMKMNCLRNMCGVTRRDFVSNEV